MAASRTWGSGSFSAALRASFRAVDAGWWLSASTAVRRMEARSPLFEARSSAPRAAEVSKRPSKDSARSRSKPGLPASSATAINTGTGSPHTARTSLTLGGSWGIDKSRTTETSHDSLVVVDAGAKWCGYSADVTRTFPVNGRFTKRQAEIYSIVLKAQLAAINACKPGVWMHEVDAAARKVISAAGYADAFMHGVGHHLGLETHDITPEGKLQKGNVVTIEPGIYLPDEELGVRIEDDVEITATGHRVLTSQIPKMIKEIEKMMAG